MKCSAFIYFRKKVEKVLSEFESMSGGIIQIENQGIQAKGAFDLLELECELQF